MRTLGKSSDDRELIAIDIDIYGTELPDGSIVRPDCSSFPEAIRAPSQTKIRARRALSADQTWRSQRSKICKAFERMKYRAKTKKKGESLSRQGKQTENQVYL